MKKTILVLYGVTAAVWLLNCAKGFRVQGSVDGFQVLCAIAWTAGFLALLRRYFRSR